MDGVCKAWRRASAGVRLWQARRYPYLDADPFLLQHNVYASDLPAARLALSPQLLLSPLPGVIFVTITYILLPPPRRLSLVFTE